ncbi:MAG: nucleotide exchange factor GrpE [Clostridia bacterium]|nr:nucleotide exchange factor GrpE [Clostridia bacterium]
MDKKKKNSQEATAAEEVIEETAQAEEVAEASVNASADTAKTEAMQKLLDAKTEECAALNDKYLRMAAEYENFRKRSAKEREGVYAEACADCIAALLPILDNLERAAQYKNDDPSVVAKGLEMTLKSFYDSLGKLGVTEIPAETFDPNVHNAVMHIEDEEHGEGEIVEVLQKGFAKGDKVIRYAMVKVAN